MGQTGWLSWTAPFLRPCLLRCAVCARKLLLFFDTKAGYHGAYLGDGLSAGAALQASAALRHAMPRTLGRHVLSQIWAYKYDAAIAQGIRPHVDQGVYSVNCW